MTLSVLGLSEASEMPMMSISRHQSTLKLLNLIPSSRFKASPHVKCLIYSLCNLNIHLSIYTKIWLSKAFKT